MELDEFEAECDTNDNPLSLASIQSAYTTISSESVTGTNNYSEDARLLALIQIKKNKRARVDRDLMKTALRLPSSIFSDISAMLHDLSKSNAVAFTKVLGQSFFASSFFSDIHPRAQNAAKAVYIYVQHYLLVQGMRF
jgi:hypothetical protein